MIRIVKQHAFMLLLGILLGLSKMPDLNKAVTCLGVSWVGSFLLLLRSGMTVNNSTHDFAKHINCFFILSAILFMLAVASSIWGVN